jgi:hypothetical protein
MEFIYRYHELPDQLIQFFTNMDTGRQGTVLTALGPTAPFTKDCGLGQGSRSAPLKWDFLLDPLLKELATLKDPYLMQDGTPISAVAFADDLGLASCTHPGYLLRVSRSDRYLSFFGIHFNADKSKYTYRTLDHHHWDPAKVTRPDGTIAPTAIATPYETLRYVGANLALAGHAPTTTDDLVNRVKSIILPLRYKRLPWDQLRYIIAVVITPITCFVASVVPIPDKALNSLDKIIGTIIRRSLRLAKGTSIHHIYCKPNGHHGLSFSNLRDSRATHMIARTHRMLNSSLLLGKLARCRLRAYRDALSMVSNPLATSHKPTAALFNNHYFARVHSSLLSLGMSIADTKRVIRRPQRRRNDTPLENFLPVKVFRKVKAELIKRKIRYIGDLADHAGTRFTHHNKFTTRNKIPVWFALLKATLCEKDGRLKHPVSPLRDTRNHLKVASAPKPGTILVTPVVSPTDASTALPPCGRETYQIATGRTGLAADESVTWEVRVLTPSVAPITAIRREKWEDIIEIQGTLWYPDPLLEPVFQFADTMYPITHINITARAAGRKPLLRYLIRDIDSIQYIDEEDKPITLHGTTTMADLHRASSAFTAHLYLNEVGEVAPHPQTDDGTCVTCDRPGLLTECDGCQAWFHPGCGTGPPLHAHTLCAPCSEPPAIEPYTPRKATYIISAGDGSVRTDHTTGTLIAGGGNIISHPRGPTLAYRMPPALPKETNSLYPEIEAIARSYENTAPHIHVVHYADNQEAIRLHDWVTSPTPPSHRTFMQ